MFVPIPVTPVRPHSWTRLDNAVSRMSSPRSSLASDPGDTERYQVPSVCMLCHMDAAHMAASLQRHHHLDSGILD
jgi:hypothetical protein